MFAQPFAWKSGKYLNPANGIEAMQTVHSGLA
jgi:hypothetical protein